jgi:hypothetical protein
MLGISDRDDIDAHHSQYAICLFEYQPNCLLGAYLTERIDEESYHTFDSFNLRRPSRNHYGSKYKHRQHTVILLPKAYPKQIGSIVTP